MADSLVGRLHSLIMEQPCRQETHDPFVIADEPSPGGPITYGYVRTSSFHLDGCGGRTDVHDLYSVLWACVLRASGAASTRLISEIGFTEIEEEIYARWLIFDQIGDFRDCSTPKERLLAHTARAFHVLDDVIGWNDIEYPASTWTDGAEQLVERLNSAGKLDDFGDMAGIRVRPDWVYAKSHQGRISVAVFSVERMVALRRALLTYEPAAVTGTDKVSILAGGLKNAIPKKTIAVGLRYLKAIEKDVEKFGWKGAGSAALDLAVVVVPLESHCIFLGMRTLVSVEADCGLRQFESERSKYLERRAQENSIFAADYSFSWRSDIDGGRFEELVYALLEREPGVIWIRQASPTKERDGGRDFLAKWVVPVGQGLGVPVASARGRIPTPSRQLNVIVQVKAGQTSVGKSKVQDIRDTVEKFEVEGYFLVAFPQPASSLVNHLESLARHKIWTNWWDRAQIESRLRTNLDLLARFSDLVNLDERRL